MSKTPYVLHALKILGLEEMLKLSEVLHTKKIPLQKAAGQDFVIFDEVLHEAPNVPKQEDAKILTFPKAKAEAPAPAESDQVNENEASTESDLFLWHQEVNKHQSEKGSQQGALKGYKRNNEIFVVKTKDENGKIQVRHASTEGVLVNKKHG